MCIRDRLDGLLAGLDETMRRGLIARLAFSEVVSMLWAAGTPIPQRLQTPPALQPPDGPPGQSNERKLVMP